MYEPAIVEIRTAPDVDIAPYLGAARRLHLAADVREGGHSTHSVSITLDGGHANAPTSEQVAVCRAILREVGRVSP